MFEKKHRYSFKKGIPKHFFTLPWCVLRFGKSEDEKLHVAMVVGKKVDKRAVVRNKIKRQQLSIIKKLVPEDAPFSLVVYARKPILEVSSEKSKKEFLEAFKKMNIL
jgi:ribonuclease P protein component